MTVMVELLQEVKRVGDSGSSSENQARLADNDSKALISSRG
jgi:hypothetical protein